MAMENKFLGLFGFEFLFFFKFNFVYDIGK
jgi:hypothetical protein